MAIIGIDLGTTNSLVSFFKEGEPTLIPNPLGEYLTPSVISYDPETKEIFVGKIAKERLITHPGSTINLFKRGMGTAKKYTLANKEFTAEELSSLIIKRLKEDAESFLGCEIEEAIISVPAYFSEPSRRATKIAGELADLNVERIVNEPTAAALAYGFHEKEDYSKFLIFDLGGGTFDISILEKYGSVMEVRAVAGDVFLGGEDFTEILLKMFAKEVDLKLSELSEKNRAILLKAIEKAKCEFVNSHNVGIKVNVDEKDYEAEINLKDYTVKCEDLLSRIRHSIKIAISDSSLSLDDIDNIILVGGATKLPVIKNFVSKLFSRFPSANINPDEVVALGCAVHAALKERDQTIQEMVLTDVCPFTLGTSGARKQENGLVVSDIYVPIIERNTIIPISRVERFYTLDDNQSQIYFKILQGESHRASENTLLGELSLSIPKAKGGEECADIRFTYDINGILEAEVTVISTGFKKSLIIENNPGIFTEQEILEKIEALSLLKIHPREKEEYRLLLSRGERLYQESLGDTREFIGRELLAFEQALNSQITRKINDATKKFKEILEDMDN
ncbi:MAG: molecular chaperone HscC [Defluviitaleaceae bacterium]|nr:molecular chaperone HscC [Defluviitaleaceae bacterium]